MTLAKDLGSKQHTEKQIINKEEDTQSGKTFAKVNYLDDFRTFLVWMDNGKTYALRLSDLPEADLTAVSKWSLSKDKSCIKVTQASGDVLEIPWDLVLHYCEPQYEFYKGKLSAEPGVDRIGEKVRQLRRTKGYSIQALADRADMKRPNLSRIENGHHRPSLDTLEKIASALGVSVADIVAKVTIPR